MTVPYPPGESRAAATRRRLKAYARVVAAALVGFTLFTGVVAGSDVVLHYQGRETRGVVLQKRPHDHGGTLYVGFDAGHDRVETRLAPGRANPEFDEVSVGDSVILTYLPWSPAVNTGGRRPPVGWDLLTLIVFGTAAVAVMAFFPLVLFADRFERAERRGSGWIDTSFPDDG